MQKLVSIVLPVYNGEQYLSESIESVLSQTYKNFELIIVNDCSTDSTEDIILRYKAKDTRIVYIKNEVNSKLPASLNNGFRMARGEFYTWTSDDNRYHPDALEKMVDHLESHPETGMVVCGYNMINQDGAYLETNDNLDITRRDLLLYNCVGACFLYRAEVAGTVGEYRTDLFLIEDYDYWLRINKEFQIDFLQDVLYEYRIHSKSLTEARKEEIRAAIGRYQWARLPEYEEGRIPRELLFKFFDSILQYKDTAVEINLCRLRFGFKHRGYFKHYIVAHIQKLFGS